MRLQHNRCCRALIDPPRVYPRLEVDEDGSPRVTFRPTPGRRREQEPGTAGYDRGFIDGMNFGRTSRRVLMVFALAMLGLAVALLARGR